MSRKISKAELDWYSSEEHFRTEKSYEEHLEDLEKKRKKNKSITGIYKFKIPKLKI